MMASFRMYFMCVVLCTVHSVHSYSIRGTIGYENGVKSEVYVSNYINGENWGNNGIVTLDRLEDAETLPTLTVANFKSGGGLILMNIALEHVPVFVNTAIGMIIKGNKIKSVPANAFSGPRPQLLSLDNNEIHSMADRSVNINAKIVGLTCNKISHFSQSWFEDPGSIGLLDLSDNRIVHIQDRAFNRMTMLQTLRLIRNHITSIGNEAFGSRIIILALQFNDIVQLSLDMFTDRYEPMTALLLHHNQLSYLPDSLLRKLKPASITLFGNPWQCQCLRDIERWLRQLRSTRRDIPARRGEPVCVVPLSFQYLCIPVADKELQQTYAKGLSPLPECLASGCKPCNDTEDFHLAELT